MRQDLTDRRPIRVHISTRLFWALIVMAVAFPILGFAISAGVLAPAWLKMDFKSMRETVQKAEETLQPLQEQNATLSADRNKLADQLKQEIQRRAEAEARVTMAETARIEASSRLGDLEGEVMNLKRSLATYERLLKPKMKREMLECVSQNVSYENGKISYDIGLAKISKDITVPQKLSVQVGVQAGNNAVALEQDDKALSTTHILEINKSQHVKGSFAVNLPSDVTRLLDVKVLDGNTAIGYCWKAF